MFREHSGLQVRGEWGNCRHDQCRIGENYLVRAGQSGSDPGRGALALLV